MISNQSWKKREKTHKLHYPKVAIKRKESNVIYVECRAIRETRVTPPSHPLVWRKFSRSLTFKEENGFGKSFFVIVVLGTVTMMVDATERRRRRRGGGGEAIGEKQEEREKDDDESSRKRRRRERECHFSRERCVEGEEACC